ncbi:MAG: serine/threonine protein kinase [Polyangiaceae bacterium]|nr:serine/threonine protein kinase [Polyangiaceae bacterium]
MPGKGPHAGALGAFGALDDDDADTQQVAETWKKEVADLPGEGALIAGRYRLGNHLSKGAFGQVWQAEDRARGGRVALKLIPKLGPQLWERFRREAAIADKLRGPHFAMPFDYGETADLAYFAMELLEGEDLARRLDREGRLPANVCVQLTLELAAGVDLAHRAGVVHRDLKPKNIFLLAGPGGAAVKILDFGIAKHAALAARVTRTGILLGTPHYMSPEQIADVRHVDHRADLWSLGAVAYRCLAGRRPFEGELSELLHRITHGAFTPPTRLVPGLAPAVDEVFERALAKDPRARFESAAALSNALSGALTRR